VTDERPADNTACEAAAQAKHEASDASVKVLFLAFAGLFVLLALTFVAMAGLFVMLDRRAAEADRPYRRARPAVNYRPSGPLLQTNPVADLQRMLARERQLMESYGWVNKPSGIVRIPVERAMDLIAQHGLPNLPPIGQKAVSPSPAAAPKTQKRAGGDGKP
jgi:hypothetical protein